MSTSNSKRVLCFGAILIAFSLCFSTLINGGLDRIETDQTDLAPDTRLADFEKVAAKIQILTLGTSHSHAFYFPTLGKEGFSYYRPGSDLAFSDLTLRLALPYTPKLSCVIVPLTPGLLNVQSGSNDRRDIAWIAELPKVEFGNKYFNRAEVFVMKFRQSKFQKNLRIWEQLQGRVVKHLSLKLRGEESGKGDVCKLHTDTAKPDEFGIRHGYRDFFPPEQCFPTLAQSTAQSHLARLDSETRMRKTQLENLNYLNSMAQILDEVGASLYLISTPTTSHYRSAMASANIEHKFVVADLLANSPNTIVMDHSGFFDTFKDAFAKGYFFDDDHLSREGAKIYSSFLASKLNHC